MSSLPEAFQSMTVQLDLAETLAGFASVSE